MKLKKKGFFLTEFVIVLVVAIVLLLAVVYKGSEALNNGRTSKALADAASLGACVSDYKLEIGSYPESLDKLKQKEGDYGPWLRSVPNDPWRHAYIYQYNDDGFVIFSCGKDGHYHGSTVNAIVNGDIGFTGK